MDPSLIALRVEFTVVEGALGAALQGAVDLSELWEVLRDSPGEMGAALGLIASRKAAWIGAGRLSQEAERLVNRLELLVGSTNKEAGRILDERARKAGVSSLFMISRPETPAPIVDTGASHCVVSASFAHEVGVVGLLDGLMVPAGGRTPDEESDGPPELLSDDDEPPIASGARSRYAGSWTGVFVWVQKVISARLAVRADSAVRMTHDDRGLTDEADQQPECPLCSRPAPLPEGLKWTGEAYLPAEYLELQDCKERAFKFCFDRAHHTCANMRCWVAQLWEYRSTCEDFFMVLGAVTGMPLEVVRVAVCNAGAYLAGVANFLEVEHPDAHLVVPLVRGPEARAQKAVRYVRRVTDLALLVVIDGPILLLTSIRALFPLTFGVFCLTACCLCKVSPRRNNSWARRRDWVEQDSVKLQAHTEYLIHSRYSPHNAYSGSCERRSDWY